MSKKLYVGNLPYSADDQSLANAFAECGNVESSKVITDRETGRSKGFAFVEMSTVEEAEECIKRFNGAELDGRAVSVMIAKPQEPRTGGSRGGFGNSNRRSY